MNYTDDQLNDLVRRGLVSPSTANGYQCYLMVKRLMAQGKSRKDAIFQAADKHRISDRMAEKYYYKYR